MRKSERIINLKIHLNTRDVDAMLPVGGSFTINVDEATCATLAIKPKNGIPMHFKKNRNPEEYKKKVEAKSNVKVVLLEIGENYNVPE